MPTIRETYGTVRHGTRGQVAYLRDAGRLKVAPRRTLRARCERDGRRAMVIKWAADHAACTPTSDTGHARARSLRLTGELYARFLGGVKAARAAALTRQPIHRDAREAARRVYGVKHAEFHLALSRLTGGGARG